KQNITAITTVEQVSAVSDALGKKTSAFISVFAGRIADTGIDPVPLMSKAVEILKECVNQKLIWASTRELLNIFQAATIACPIITVTNAILKKISWIGKDLNEVSLSTVKMFSEDAIKSGFVL
ncbi:MAG: transaldolase family protein, partial [Rickettsiella sp.]|nr:transaldolase family protein [Rickettsiella sp.]